MDTCQYENRISAYYDGELNDADRNAFEQHLSACPACQTELQQHRLLSAFMKLAPRKQLSQRARQDLYALAPAVGEGVYLRIAEWTTALAASVLIAASLWLFHTHPGQPNSETAVLSPVVLNPPQAHDASDLPDDPQLIDYVTASAAAGQNQ
jgi:anti-sigma factor RsiW